MKLLNPIGLLGLLAVAVLIIIYLLRPNFLQKRISSTFVWKLSLKYKKRKIPISKLRNILIILCQILILCLCAAILAKPNLILRKQQDKNEMIAIIDSSASMRTQNKQDSRFNRAIASALSDYNAMPEDSVFSVIIAENTPKLLLDRVPASNKEYIIRMLQGLADNEDECSYGTSDIDAAVAICENILKTNPIAQIKLYTDTTYERVPSGIKVIPIYESGEWNAGILNAYSEINDNFFVFYVEVGCYGKATDISLQLEVHDANALDSNSAGRTIIFDTVVRCALNTPRTVIFKYFAPSDQIPVFDDDVQKEHYIISGQDRISSYRSVHITIDVDDSFSNDDTFDLYGGEKETIRIQYASPMPNRFVRGALMVYQEAYRDTWNVRCVEVSDGNFATQGFDYYIFEHQMPDVLPIDGAVLLMDPDKAPLGSNIRISGTYDFGGRSVYLVAENQHYVTTDVVANKITVSKYVGLNINASDYIVLMSYDTRPVLLLNDNGPQKIAIMSFSVHFSNIAALNEFPRFMAQFFEHAVPPMVKAEAYEVYDNVTIQTRGDSVKVSGEYLQKEYYNFPATLTMSIPGSYTLSQNTFSGKYVEKRIYAKIPANESNIWKVDYTIRTVQLSKSGDLLESLLIYLAATLAAILFIERWLHNREQV